MTDQLRAAIDSAVADLDAIADPVERYRAARGVRALLDAGNLEIKAVQQQVSLTLKNGRPWREVGELLGVSGSRAEQISKGK